MIQIIPCLGIYPREMKICLYRKFCPGIVVEALFKIAKKMEIIQMPTNRRMCKQIVVDSGQKFGKITWHKRRTTRKEPEKSVLNLIGMEIT